jgi:glycosyltransferase involved in cell wall biosynthesis
MTYPKISIITPSFNQGVFIEQTISSVLEQNYPNLEFIIIDGGSKDNTLEILKKNSKFISYWISEPDLGQSHAINKGLKQCSGEIFNWLNSDDFLEKSALFEIGKLFQNSNTNLVSGRCKKFSDDGIVKIIPENFISQSIEEKIYNPLYMQPSTFIRMDCIKKMGLLNENLHYCMDFEWILRYILLFGIQGIVEVDTIFSSARLHNKSKTILNIPEFKKETLTIYYNLAKQLSFPKEFLEKLELTKFIQPIDLKWQIDANFRPQILQSNILELIEPYFNDRSFLYRESASYYSFFGQNKAAINSSFKGICVNPFKILNYKFMVKEIYKVIKSWISF